MSHPKGQRFPHEPDFAIPPGRTLNETLDYLGLDATDVARQCGLDDNGVQSILDGSAPISHATAAELERITGVPARLWSNLETNYQALRRRLSAVDE